jgi:acyl-coenzyme A thioesterase PaaI-like protein
MSTSVVSAWNRLAPLPLGRRLFSRIVCWKAPYFATIRPLVEELKPGRCRVSFRKRRITLNHLRSVHAIAMCNAAELAAGLMTDASIPGDLRWIPTGMVTHYRKLATTDLVVTARPSSANAPSPGEYVVDVSAEDIRGEIVFEAAITMRLSTRKSAPVPS